MTAPKELSIEEIRKYMLANDSKVTNHALVKHFKRFLTNPATQDEARTQFKTYVNILATIKNENNQKYLILRKKFLNEGPSNEMAERAVATADAVPSSPGGASIISESGLSSPYREPPPYKHPPEFSTPKLTKVAATTAAYSPSICTSVEKENVENYRDCVNEFAAAVEKIEPSLVANQPASKNDDVIETSAVENIETKTKKQSASFSRENSIKNSDNKENIPRFSFSSGTSGDSSAADKVSSSDGDVGDNPISVKEATRKFNRMASEEEAKIISPPTKKKQEKPLIEEKVPQEVLLAHAKAKEWIVAMAKGSYQELAKLANEYPELVKLQDPSTGYTALHWASKHGKEDIVKLIAGTHNADVNARTNGGYTPLHLAMQFGRENIFELLCNVYKANRDLMDWSGNKPLDYLKQRTSVSLSTYSSEYYDLLPDPLLLEQYNINLFGINNIRLNTGGGTISGPLTRAKKRSHLRYSTLSIASGSPVTRTHSMLTTSISRQNGNKPPTKSVVLKNDIFPMWYSSDHANNRRTQEGDVSSEDVPYRKEQEKTSTKTHRKESFLRKTLRAAATSNKSNNEIVTKTTLTE